VLRSVLYLLIPHLPRIAYCTLHCFTPHFLGEHPLAARAATCGNAEGALSTFVLLPTYLCSLSCVLASIPSMHPMVCVGIVPFKASLSHFLFSLLNSYPLYLRVPCVPLRHFSRLSRALPYSLICFPSHSYLGFPWSCLSSFIQPPHASSPSHTPLPYLELTRSRHPSHMHNVFSFHFSGKAQHSCKSS
jgi:hypothetical protein